jgi:1,4-dihydroxy-2-naphthoyl-CoA hydrolase
MPALPEWVRSLPQATLAGALGIEIVELSADRVVATMPVDDRTRQPYGLLHGGASMALAETVASLGTAGRVDRERLAVVGQEINGNHIRAVKEGTVRATGVPVHVGRTSQVWSIEIRDEAERLVCISRCTLAVVELRGSSGAR